MACKKLNISYQNLLPDSKKKNQNLPKLEQFTPRVTLSTSSPLIWF